MIHAITPAGKAQVRSCRGARGPGAVGRDADWCRRRGGGRGGAARGGRRRCRRGPGAGGRARPPRPGLTDAAAEVDCHPGALRPRSANVDYPQRCASGAGAPALRPRPQSGAASTTRTAPVAWSSAVCRHRRMHLNQRTSPPQPRRRRKGPGGADDRATGPRRPGRDRTHRRRLGGHPAPRPPGGDLGGGDDRTGGVRCGSGRGAAGSGGRPAGGSSGSAGAADDWR